MVCTPAAPNFEVARDPLFAPLPKQLTYCHPYPRVSAVVRCPMHPRVQRRV